jgi:hypothetical protein
MRELVTRSSHRNHDNNQIRSQTSIFSAKQEAISKAIYKSTRKALEEDINDRDLYPPQNWMKKADTKNRQERLAQGENTMRFRKETIEWKDDSTNLIRKKKVVISRLRTGYTRATHTQ